MEELFGFEFERPILQLESKIAELKAFASSEKMDFNDELARLQERLESLKSEIYGTLSPWQRVQIARHPKRPYSLDYIKLIFDDFIELHGDKNFADDKAIVAGLASLAGETVAVIGHQKGRSVQESMERNFGMPHPEGYRKALRLMQMAGNFGFPVITFIDTPGAYPGIGAEERGQAEAIARNLKEMSVLPVPIICCVIGEGGSGGALAIAVGDVLLMLENAWYSVISPEGCAAILFRDASKAPEAADSLHLTAQELKELGVIDEIIPEPAGGSHRDPEATAARLKQSLKTHVENLKTLSKKELIEKRYQKLKGIGANTNANAQNGSPSVKKNAKILVAI